MPQHEHMQPPSDEFLNEVDFLRHFEEDRRQIEELEREFELPNKENISSNVVRAGNNNVAVKKKKQ